MKKIFLFIFFVSAITLKSYTQPGTLDRTFGDTGVVKGSDYTGTCNSSALQKDGKILVGGVGYIINQGIGGFLLVRYNSDGSIDNNFGIDGKTAVDIAGSEQSLVSINILPDDKILTVGQIDVDIVLMRYLSNGNLDSSFGTNGVVRSDLGIREFPTCAVVQADGKIVVAGYTQLEIYYENQPFIARYMPDGTLDESFGDKGKLFITRDVFAEFYSIALQPDGKIVAGTQDYRLQFMVMRFLPDGNMDGSFGDNGIASIKFPPNVGARLYSLALQSDGKIVCGGDASIINTINWGVALVRYNINGSPDTSFADNGIRITAFLSDNANAISILLQNDGKIVSIGNNYDFIYSRYWHYALARYKTNGALDSTFGENGLQTTIVTETDFPSSAFLQPDGKIVVAGTSGSSYFDLLRYNGDHFAKYVKVKRWLHHHGITWDDCPDWLCNNLNYYKIERSSNGNSFTEIARIFKGQKQNSFEDAAPLSGTNYYRLAAVSTDGSTTYSNVVAVEDETASIKLYPNPVKNTLHIEGLSATQRTKLTILDFTGNVKATTAIAASNYNWNISQLKPGNYLLRIETDGNVVSKKFVKE